MKISRITATAAVAIGATAIAAGSAYAAPATTQPARHAQVSPAGMPVLTGTDHGVGYYSAMSADHRSVVSTLDAGEFRFDGDHKTISVSDAQGRVFGTIPTGIRVGGRQMALSPVIDQSGKRLTLTTIGQPTQLKDIGSGSWFLYELQRAAPGALVGGIIGLLVGLFVFGIGAIPGAVIGAIIGELVMGGQPLIDSGFAYFGGR